MHLAERADAAPRRVVFFDVDKTLLEANSGTLWLRRELRLGHINKWQAMRGAFWLTVYALGFARMESLIADAVKVFRNLREESIAERTAAFFHEEVRRLLRPRALDTIEAHRARGEALYLLTTSSTYLTSLIAEELRMDGYLCNRLEVEEGRFTGRLHSPVCFGEGKVAHARGLTEKLGVALEDCAFYTDSFSDLPMLLAVGQPVVVNPDMRLRRYAQKLGWKIEDWSMKLSAER